MVMTLDNVITAMGLFNSRRPYYLKHEITPEIAQRILDGMRSDFKKVIGRPRIKYINEGGKIRRLQVPRYESVIAQTALWNVCGKYVEKRIHNQSFSSRKNMGGHLAARKCAKYMHTHGGKEARYCLYFDIKKYYQHIDRRIMMDRLRYIFKDDKILDMFDIVLSSADEGLPIGYPFSHALANLYLTPLYFLIKSIKGIGKIYVYMDNWTVFSRYKKPLHSAKRHANIWLAGVGCKVKDDWQIFKTEERGVKICGFVIYANRKTHLYRRIWARTVNNFRQYIEHQSSHKYFSLMSRLGWLKAIHQEYNPIFKTKKGNYVWSRG